MLAHLFALYALSTFSLTTTIVHYCQPFFLVGARMTSAGIVLLAYQWLFARDSFTYKRAHISLYTQVMVFAIFLPYFFRFWGLTHASSIPRAYLLYNSGPFITYGMTLLYGLETNTKPKVIALALSLCSTLFYFRVPISNFMQPWHSADVALIAAVMSFSYGWIILRKLLVEFQYAPVMINGITMLGGGILGLGASLLGETAPYATNLTMCVPLLIGIIVISNCIGHTLYAHLVRTYSLTLIQIGYTVTPAITSIFHLMLKPEPLSWSLGASACLGLAGFMLYYWQECHSKDRELARARTEKNPITLS